MAQPITGNEARAIIEQRMADKALREASREAELESMTAIDSHVVQKERHRVSINRVVPPQLKDAPEMALKNTQASRTWTEEWAAIDCGTAEAAVHFLVSDGVRRGILENLMAKAPQRGNTA